MLAPTSSLEAFKRYVKSFPKLTQEEENELAIKKDQGCLKSARKLVDHNLFIVSGQASKFRLNNCEEADLIQEGAIGLMQAVKNFKPDSSRFSTYATSYVRGQIFDFIFKNRSIVRMTDSKENRKAFWNAGRFERNPEQMEELAENLGVSMASVRTALVARNPAKSIYDEEGVLMYDVASEELEDVVEDELTLKQLEPLINRLESKRKEVITRRYLTDNPDTRAVLAADLKVSNQRIAEIEQSALRQLREALCD